MISAIVLAAGLSTRMGRAKQLLPYGEHTVIEQIVFYVWVSFDDPHITQHLEQHACRAASTARAAKFFDDVPAFFAKEADNNFTVGVRRVVIRDFSNSSCG